MEHLSLRRTTNLTTVTNVVLSYPVRTVLANETTVYLEDPTVEFFGARHVLLKSTRFASMPITANLQSPSTARSSTIASYRRASTERIDTVHVTLVQKTCDNSTLLLKWLDLVFPWCSMQILVVKEGCGETKIQEIVFPTGMTPYLQAGDIGIYNFFRDNISPHCMSDGHLYRCGDVDYVADSHQAWYDDKKQSVLLHSASYLNMLPLIALV
ncbi:hypothetical protein PsorP6_004641 [Peronosclerospora sorghi]|uniref:Uncharacterized protein n=1 Tax=Peronosclerospora sorghi TaxID=230839 RepID=A0ACC0VN37_9STRA|nr:hypothetical protein PsorP6_004641 [Peronosclerospora sorghi]